MWRNFSCGYTMKVEMCFARHLTKICTKLEAMKTNCVVSLCWLYLSKSGKAAREHHIDENWLKPDIHWLGYVFIAVTLFAMFYQRFSIRFNSGLWPAISSHNFSFKELLYLFFCVTGEQLLVQKTFLKPHLNSLWVKPFQSLMANIMFPIWPPQKCFHY